MYKPDNRERYEKAFCKGGSAAFIVESTFQLMCAREAIHEFEIEEYHIVMATFESYGPRNHQMLQTAKKWDFAMEQIDMATVDFEAFFASEATLDNSRKRYDRVFLGNRDNLNMLAMSADYARTGGAVVLLDDGTASIGQLKDIYHGKKPSNDWVELYHWNQGRKAYLNMRQAIYDKLAEKGICFTDDFYTIFDDLASPRHVTYKNTFSHLLSQPKATDAEQIDVVVVGTTVEEMAKIFSVAPEYMEQKFSEILRCIRKRYPDETIIYVPHPRDASTCLKDICEELKIVYTHLSVPIESYVLSHSQTLKSVYGLGSTALIVLKKILPDVNITNIEFGYSNKSKLDCTRAELQEYYRNSGMQIKRIVLSSVQVESQQISFLHNCSKLFEVFMRKCRNLLRKSKMHVIGNIE